MQNSEKQTEQSSENQIVSLSEDLNFHAHNQADFDRLKREQQAANQSDAYRGGTSV